MYFQPTEETEEVVVHNLITEYEMQLEQGTLGVERFEELEQLKAYYMYLVQIAQTGSTNKTQLLNNSTDLEIIPEIENSAAKMMTPIQDNQLSHYSSNL
jgi:hypothetical protein